MRSETLFICDEKLKLFTRISTNNTVARKVHFISRSVMEIYKNLSAVGFLTSVEAGPCAPLPATKEYTHYRIRSKNLSVLKSYLLPFVADITVVLDSSRFLQISYMGCEGGQGIGRCVPWISTGTKAFCATCRLRNGAHTIPAYRYSINSLKMKRSPDSNNHKMREYI
jgi:hypothetical protein